MTTTRTAVWTKAILTDYILSLLARLYWNYPDRSSSVGCWTQSCRFGQNLRGHGRLFYVSAITSFHKASSDRQLLDLLRLMLCLSVLLFKGHNVLSWYRFQCETISITKLHIGSRVRTISLHIRVSSDIYFCFQSPEYKRRGRNRQVPTTVGALYVDPQRSTTGCTVVLDPSSCHILSNQCRKWRPLDFRLLSIIFPKWDSKHAHPPSIHIS